jgi:hypothetical protein
VVLGAAAAIFFLTRPGSGNQADNPPVTQVETQKQTSKAPPTPSGPKLPDGPFVSITGAGDAPVIRDSTPIDEAVAAGAPTGPESKLLKQSGVGSISAISTTEGEMLRGIWSFTPSAGADPKTILAAINKEYQEAGHRQQASTKPGVTIWALPADANNKLNSYRAHFITGGNVVRVEVYGPDATASKSAFDDLIERVTTKFPPTE